VDTRLRHETRFRKALLLSLLNPKAILFFLSFFVQFVDPSKGHTGLAFMLLGLVVELISICYLSLLIFGGDRLAGIFRRHQRLSRMGNGSVGLLFMGFAARMISD
jgi:leucine efflux protein